MICASSITSAVNLAAPRALVKTSSTKRVLARGRFRPRLCENSEEKFFGGTSPHVLLVFEQAMWD